MGPESVAVGLTPRRSKRQRPDQAKQQSARKKRAVASSETQERTVKAAADPPAPAPSADALNAGPPSPPLDRETLVQAAEALLSYRAKTSEAGGSKMLDSDSDGAEPADAEQDIISVVMTFKRAPKRAALSPRTVPLVHPLFAAGQDDVCLFVKDPQRLVKDHLAKEGVTSVTKVLGVSKLEKRYGTHEAKRELAQLYDLFLVDDRVVKMMPRLLGNTFIRGKKMPLVVRMDRNVPAGIDKALRSTAYAPGTGTTCTVRVARASFCAGEIADNISSAMESIAASVPGNWSAFQSLYIKTLSSPALPIFSSLPTSADFVPTPEEQAVMGATERRKRRAEQEKAAKAEKEAKAKQKRLQKKEEKAATRRQKRAGTKNMPEGNESDSESNDSSEGVTDAIMRSFEAGEADFLNDLDSDDTTGHDSDGEDDDAGVEAVDTLSGEEGNCDSEEGGRSGDDSKVVVPAKRKTTEKERKKSKSPGSNSKEAKVRERGKLRKKSRK